MNKTKSRQAPWSVRRVVHAVVTAPACWLLRWRIRHHVIYRDVFRREFLGLLKTRQYFNLFYSEERLDLNSKMIEVMNRHIYENNETLKRLKNKLAGLSWVPRTLQNEH